MNTHEITLDVSKEPAHEPTLYLGQGDMNGTTLVANLFDNGEVLDLTGLSVKFCMRTPDMLDYYEVAGSVSGNVATFLIDETYAAGHPGNTDIAYVQIFDGDTESTSTARMRVVVLPSAKDGVVPAPAYKSLIEEFLENAQEEVDEAVAAAQAIVDYSVPLMSSTMRGGAKLGSGLTVEDETLSVDTSILVTQAEKGAANGVAELDQNGLVLSSQLPSYVDDVLEYASTSQFPATGESGKIYVAVNTNLTYRWTGSAYTEISPSLALGETSSTAYRGDRGAAAYAHAVTNKGAAFASDLYKITTNSEGHVTAAIPATSADIVAFLNNQAITPSSVTSTGEVTATKTSGGTTSLHKLTEKADMAVVESRSKCWYGECTTAAATAAKTVTCAGFELVKGAMIAVHFSYTNTADEATMNVNSTGAKYITTGNTISGQDNFWYAGEIMMFTYDGTYWRPANMAGINALRDSQDQSVMPITSLLVQTDAIDTNMTYYWKTGISIIAKKAWTGGQDYIVFNVPEACRPQYPAKTVGVVSGYSASPAFGVIDLATNGDLHFIPSSNFNDYAYIRLTWPQAL